MPNFYGTDYGAESGSEKGIEIQSDRLFGVWRLNSPKVVSLASGAQFITAENPAAEVIIPGNWAALVSTDRMAAAKEQTRIRTEFQKHFAEGLKCRGFVKDVHKPKYLLYKN
jgi:hypothetical protein